MMSAGGDYYRLLEIPVSASESEIKKAYRKMALKWHPDKNPGDQAAATNMFNKISEAYEVLSDKNKRDTYDRYGMDGLNGTRSQRGNRQQNATPTPFTTSQHFSFNFRDPFDVFREFFGDRDPFAEMFSRDFPVSAHNFPRGLNVVIGNGNNSPSLGRSASWSSRSRQGGHHHTRPFSATHRLLSSTSLVGFSPFFTDSFLGGSGVSASMTFGTGSRSVSTSTRTVNGRTVTTKTVVENGAATTTVEENGVLMSKTINGQAQPISHSRPERTHSTRN